MADRLEVGIGRSIEFVVVGPLLTDVEVSAEDGRTIGVGRHERRIVNRDPPPP